MKAKAKSWAMQTEGRSSDKCKTSNFTTFTIISHASAANNTVQFAWRCWKDALLHISWSKRTNAYTKTTYLRVCMLVYVYVGLLHANICAKMCWYVRVYMCLAASGTGHRQRPSTRLQPCKFIDSAWKATS